MSARRSYETSDVAALRQSINNLQEAVRAQEIDAHAVSASAARAEREAKANYEALTETEKAAANLGVHPDSWRPISFINAKHYESLLKSNALSDDLARRIEAFRAVASAS
ncbi:MAG: hypothetical protein VXA08_02315 [Alphaproteobacteria bacterium]